MAQQTASAHKTPTAAHAHVGHIVPAWLYLVVLLVLLLLTGATVWVTQVDLGAWNVWIALIIATIKAALVALIFMHLAYDRPFVGVVFITTLAFVGLFIGLALFDAFQYRGAREAYLQDLPPGVTPSERYAPKLVTERQRVRDRRAEQGPHDAP